MGVSMPVTALALRAHPHGSRHAALEARRGRAGLRGGGRRATAWCLLAIVVGTASCARASDSLYTLAFTLVYVIAMLAIVRPVVRRLVHRQEIVGKLSRGATATVFIRSPLSARPEAIGIHALCGAFLLGAIIPHESRLAQEITPQAGGFQRSSSLPAFFAFTGARTFEIGLLEEPPTGSSAALIILVACLGKFGGSAVAARLSGLGWHESAALGVLMNTRGLMELIVLNLGLDLGVISPRLFDFGDADVIMAVVTTLMTTPVLRSSTVARSSTARCARRPEPVEKLSLRLCRRSARP